MLWDSKKANQFEGLTMDVEKFWSTTDLNKFIYQKTKELCEAEGFVASPRRSKHLVRIGEHHIHIVYPEIWRSRTIIHFGVSPATSFNNHAILGDAKIYLRKNNDPDDLFNEYFRLATDINNPKWSYDSEKMKAVWDEVVVPQLTKEMLSILRTFTFEQFITLCENRKNGILRYGRNPGIDDAPLYMARGHNRIWKGNVKESISLLEQAILGYDQHFIRCKNFGEEILLYIQQEFFATQKLLSIIKNRDIGIESYVLDYMRKLEEIALNKTWGVMLSSDGKTIRLKKKELL